MIDAAGTRNDAVSRHVPDIVLLLMLLTLAMTSLTLGFVSGLGRHPVSIPAYSLLVVILLVTHVIIDLDRPRRGVITVSQDSLLDLQRSIAKPGTKPGR
jgi:MFS superfamily sulfate permease-like transporter